MVAYFRNVALLVFCSLMQMGMAVAQVSCEKLLAGGVFETRTSSTVSLRQRSFINWFCSQNYGSENQMLEHVGSLGIPIDGIPLQMHGEFRDQNWKQYYSNACTLQDDFANEMDKAKSFDKTVSVDLLNAFNRCIDGAGLKMLVVSSRDPRLFSLELNYKSTLTNADAANIRQLLAFQVDKSGHYVSAFLHGSWNSLYQWHGLEF